MTKSILTLAALLTVCATAGSAQPRLRTNTMPFGLQTDRAQSVAEKDAWLAAVEESDRNLVGIDASSSVRAGLNGVLADYIARRTRLWNEGNANALAGRSDPTFVARIDSMRLDEREALRRQLNSSQWAEYDRNVMGNMKPVAK